MSVTANPFASERDQRPPRFAWAPGSYIAHCSQCDKQFVGDKRARLCAPCAYNDEGLAELRRACVSVGELAGAHERLRAEHARLLERIETLPRALYDSTNVSIIGDGCCSRDRDEGILGDIISTHLKA